MLREWVKKRFIGLPLERVCSAGYVDVTRWADGPASEANRVKEAGAIDKSLSYFSKLS